MPPALELAVQRAVQSALEAHSPLTFALPTDTLQPQARSAQSASAQPAAQQPVVPPAERAAAQFAGPRTEPDHYEVVWQLAQQHAEQRHSLSDQRSDETESDEDRRAPPPAPLRDPRRHGSLVAPRAHRAEVSLLDKLKLDEVVPCNLGAQSSLVAVNCSIVFQHWLV